MEPRENIKNLYKKIPTLYYLGETESWSCEGVVRLVRGAVWYGGLKKGVFVC